MAKMAQYFSEAERLYVHEGFAIDNIVKILKGKVSRKTLYNWRAEGDWEKKREQAVETSLELRDEMLEIAQLAIKRAKKDPAPASILGINRALEGLKILGILKKQESDGQKEEDEGDEKGGLSPELIEQIEKEILKMR